MYVCMYVCMYSCVCLRVYVCAWSACMNVFILPVLNVKETNTSAYIVV